MPPFLSNPIQKPTLRSKERPSDQSLRMSNQVRGQSIIFLYQGNNLFLAQREKMIK